MKTYEFTWHVDGLISVKVRSDNPDKAFSKALKLAHERVNNQSIRGATTLNILDDTPHIWPDDWEEETE